jgi:hypothetical protein
MFRITACALLIIVATALPVRAADSPATQGESAAFSVSAAALPVKDTDWSLSAPTLGNTHGALLPSLYVSLGALNAFDAMTTSKGLASGMAAEANPVIRGLAGNPAALWAVKGGATAATIFFAERLWRGNRRTQAIAVMLVSNGMMAAVAAHNTNVLRAAR